MQSKTNTKTNTLRFYHYIKHCKSEEVHCRNRALTSIIAEPSCPRPGSRSGLATGGRGYERPCPPQGPPPSQVKV